MKYIKIFSLFLFAGFLSINTAFAVNSTSPSSSFTDIYKYHIYSDSVETLKNTGVLEGYADGTFKPENKINRAEFVKIVMKAAKINASGENCFKDVKKEWYAQYICGAKTKGIIKGYADGKFYPGKNINFVEAAKIIAVAFEMTPDKTNNESWYHPYVKLMEGRKMIPFSISGFNHELTRGGMAEMMAGATMHNAYFNSLSYVKTLTYSNLKSFDSKNKAFSVAFEVFYGHKLPIKNIAVEVDPATFGQLKSGSASGSALLTPDLYRDKNHVYYYPPSSKEAGLFLMREVDQKTFQVFDSNLIPFIFDKNYVYILDQQVGRYVIEYDIEPNKKHIFKNIFTDGKDVYYYNLSAHYAGSVQIKINGVADKVVKKGFIKVEGVDPKTFKNKEDGLFEDKNYYYFFNTSSLFKLDVDKDSFEIIDSSPAYSGNTTWVISKDKNHVYYSSLSMDNLKKFDGADPTSFKLLSKNDDIKAQDKNTLFYVDWRGKLTKSTSVDTATMEDIKTGGDDTDTILYLKDKSHVYRASDFAIVSWADPKTFEVSAYSYGYGYGGGGYGDAAYFIYGKNKSNFWFYDDKNKKEVVDNTIDVSTFEIMSDIDFSVNNEKNKTTKSSYTDKEWCAEGKAEYDEMKAIYTEIKSFTVLSDGTCEMVVEEENFNSKKYYKGILAKDKNSVWQYDNQNFTLKKVEGIDGATLEEVIEDVPILFKDKNGVYNFKGYFDTMVGADPETFEVVYLDSKDPMSSDYIFIKDKNYVWFVNETAETFDRELDADPKTIKFVTFEKDLYIKDKSNIWEVKKGGYSVIKINNNYPKGFMEGYKELP